MFAARVAFEGNGEAAGFAFAAGVALSGGDDGVFRVTNAQVFPAEGAVQLWLEQVAADVDVAVDVAADDGQQAVERRGGDVQVERGAGGVGVAVGTDAVARQL